jgi:MoaA/NifB/PqqE/SkfB family radical SAM enzyme
MIKSRKYLNLEITNLCNLKCTICDIWKNKISNKLELDDIKNIFNSSHISKDTDITITWGEPFLHKGLINIINLIYKQGYKISTISTNWTTYHKLNNLLWFYNDNNYKKPNIHISIDWNKSIHDKQRWVKWSFKKSIETILKLKQQYQDINIKLKYTITKNNIECIEYAYLLAKKIWTNISYKLVENDENYTNKQDFPDLLNDIEKQIVKKKLLKLYWNKDKYINNLTYYIDNNKLLFECKTPEKSLFIMADWKVFPCTKYNSIWNIKCSNIDNIIYNALHKDIIKNVKNIKCSKCFSLHGAYKSIT